MDCIHQQVTHKKFGVGCIKEHDGHTMTVAFREWGTRTFLYPDAFGDFLHADDPEFAKAVQADLDSEWEKQADQEREHRQHLMEITEQARRERIQERRKTAPRSKKK